MPRYKRYGYIVIRTLGYDLKQFMHSGSTRIMGFHPNPAKAHEQIDLYLEGLKTSVDAPFEVTDTSFEPDPDHGDHKIRGVLIKYPESEIGARDYWKIERWWFEVGRTNE